MDKYFAFNKIRGAYHASTILQRNDGDLLVAAFSGSEESKPDVGIALAHFCIKYGRSSEVTFIKTEETPHWNPVLFRLSEDKIALYFKVGKTPVSWKTYVSESYDEGKTWGKPYLLVADDIGGRGAVKNKPIRLSNGDIVAGGSTEIDIWKSFVDISHDNGLTWEKHDIPYKFVEVNDKLAKNALALIQPTLWESQPGTLHALMRSNNHKIYRSDSSDFGKTWNFPYPIEVNNNNSGIDLLKLEDGRLLLAHNSNNENWGARNQLNISISTDNGKTFELVKILEKADLSYEYSYPAIIQLDKKHCCVSYTYRRTNIALAFYDI
jgi:predicted neuraminidase